jgi:hypothetical protein
VSQVIISIAGKACAGKSTLALALYRALPRDNNLFIRSIARPIKTGLWNMTGIPETEQNKEEYREGYQWYGNFMRAHEGEDHWVRRLLRNASLRDGESLIVDDVRLPAELSALQEGAAALSIPFFSIRIEITPEEQQARHIARCGSPMSEQRRLDITETALDGYRGFDLWLQADRMLVSNVAMALGWLRDDGIIPPVLAEVAQP